MNQRYQPITRLGLGDMYHATSDKAARTTVDVAWEAGIRYFDTAPHYGAGLSEHRFGSALRNRPRDDYTLSTKVGRLLAPASTGEIAAPFVSALPFRRVLDYAADGARRAVEDGDHAPGRTVPAVRAARRQGSAGGTVQFGLPGRRRARRLCTGQRGEAGAARAAAPGGGDHPGREQSAASAP